jgi:hypothetical protein
MVKKNSNERPGSGVAPRKLADVELEIVRSEIAYLKAKEVKSGDWAKWEADQKQWKNYENYREHWARPLGLQYISVDGAPLVEMRSESSRLSRYNFINGCNCQSCQEYIRNHGMVGDSG